MVLMFITLPSSLLLTIELFFGHYIDYVNIAGLSPMGKNRPDHLLQDTQSVKTHAAVIRRITAQWLLRLDGVVIQRVNPLLNIPQ